MALTVGFSSGAMLRWAGLVAAAFWGTCCFQAFAANRSVKTALVPVALLILGLNTIPLPGGMTVGSILATALSLASAAMGGTCALAVACGLGLDLARSSGGAMTAMLAFGALFVLVVRRRPRGLRPTVFAVACTAGSLLWANGDSTLVVGLPLALLLAAPLCLLPWKAEERQEDPKKRLRRQLEQASVTLERLQSMLTAGRRERQAREIDLLFDNAAAKVCRDCGQWSRCWRDHGTETYQLLSRAAQGMLQRGSCRTGDFPESFVEGCHRIGAFAEAVDQELQLLLCRRQYRRRIRESRTVLSQQYRCLAAFLRRTAIDLGAAPAQPPEPAYRVELGIRTQGRESCCGDRSDSFAAGNNQYILLCDGMGTGEAAAQEADAAVCTLRELLQAGMMPYEAMELLSGTYLLRDTSAFATVDLLQLDLVSGEGILYKWGAAPSYLRLGTVVRKIGTASPPPGLEVGETRRAEGVRLSLREGEMLVMLSDGAAGDAAERAVAAYDGDEPGEMAAQVIAEAALAHGEEDDRTVLAVSLRPCRAGQPATHQTASCTVS